MFMGNRSIFIVLICALLSFSGCAELQPRDAGRPHSPGSLQPPSDLQLTESEPLWQKQADQLERLGDYNGACQVVRERYLRSPDVEVGDRFSLLLSYLSDEQVGDWWLKEDDSGLSCRVSAEYFMRLSRQPASEQSIISEKLLLELARKSSAGCDLSEDIRAQAQDYLLLHQSLSVKDAITVGCLLPLSGSNAGAGQHLLRGMELALGVYPEVIAEVDSGSATVIPEMTELSETDEIVEGPKIPELSETVSAPVLPLPGVRLLLYDTAGEGERARAGVRYLVNEKKVDLLIGPYTGKAANYAAAEAQSLGATMISLSPLLRNLERYPNVFQHYPTIRNQATSLADLAMTRLGLKDFALLVPKNHYGRKFAEIFADQVSAWGGQVVRQVYYDSSRPDFGPAIRELIGVQRYRDFKQKRKEYEAWDKERQRQAEKGDSASQEEDKLARLAREIGIEKEESELFAKADEIMPRPLLDCDFEAIVVPDRSQTLELLIPQLAFYDLEESFLLGGRYWNSPELLSSTAEYADGALFVDALCSGCAGASTELKEFQERFMALYQEEARPGLLETYGFDTIMLIRKIGAGMGVEFDAEVWRQALAECRNLPLASGLTSTLGDGEIAKQLYPLTFHKGRIETVNECCN